MASKKTTVPKLGTDGPPLPSTAQAKAAEATARKKKARTPQGTPVFDALTPMPEVAPPRSRSGTEAKAQTDKNAGTRSKPKAAAPVKEPTKAEVKAAFRRTTESLTAAAQAFAKLGKQVEAAGATLPSPDPALPQPKNWRGSPEFAYVRNGILAALRKSGRSDDPLVLDKVDEYMDFWVQRRMLAQDVETRGLMVTDDRGRIQENRSASLGVQVSKQMSALAGQLGLISKAKPAGDGADSGEEDEEDDL